MPAPALEIWGGIECTINRTGDRFRSQLALNGHLERIESDLEAFESLGLSALRYPVLWEQVEHPSGERDFRAPDRAMRRLRGSGMRPIVGLLHHGSGPLGTSLVDPGMPVRFAEFAAAVARRYPWVRDYTPINEPLTTSRFSGLYGHWYPHARSDSGFVTALLTQTRATVLAMRAIREVNPAARLIQTEDLGRASGTDQVRRQVRFENDRRWLSFDLLCGRVVPGHPLYDYLTGMGQAAPAELAWLAENPCPPDVLGINHYPRSNRWLDHRLDLHPGSEQSSVRYADVGACDSPLATRTPVSSLIDETWDRYGIAVALTEVHIPGDFPGRTAWWWDAVAAATAASARGADVRAVTTWSLLGAFDWDTLCTSADERVTYEDGAFDISAGERRETPLAAVIRGTARATLAMPRTLHATPEQRKPLRPVPVLSDAGVPGGAI